MESLSSQPSFGRTKFMLTHSERPVLSEGKEFMAFNFGDGSWCQHSIHQSRLERLHHHQLRPRKRSVLLVAKV